MPSTAQSDIEIYIKDSSIDSIQDWLKLLFTDVTTVKEGKKIHHVRCTYQAQEIDIEILLEAVGKRFTCLWFQSSSTPWKTDVECARAAFAHFTTEVRCSEGDWTETDAVPEKQLWWRINTEGEALVSWS